MTYVPTLSHFFLCEEVMSYHVHLYDAGMFEEHAYFWRWTQKQYTFSLCLEQVL